MRKLEETNGDKRLWPAVRRILALARPYRWRLAAAITATLLGTVVWLVVPLGLRDLLDSAFEAGNRGLLDRLALGLLVLFALQAAFNFAGYYGLEWTGERVVADLRKALYSHLHRLGLRFYADGRVGEITSRLTNDVTTVRNAVTEQMAQAITQTFTLIGSVGLMLLLNMRLAVVVFIVAPVVSVLAIWIGRIVRRLARQIQDRVAQTTAIAEEALTSIRVVKAFAREDYETARYAGAVEQVFDASKTRALVTAGFWSGVGMLFLLALVAIFWFGGIEVLEGRLTAGDLVAFIFYAFNIAQSVGAMSRLYAAFNTAAGASERLFELLDSEPELNSPIGAPDLPRVEGHVVFDNVAFAYDPNRPVLSNISFEALPGQTVAIVGPSGAGKTTLIHLVPRFYDPTSGRILIDGFDAREVDVASLRRQVGLVAQDVQLFGASIGENIRYGRLDASDAEVRDAAVAANAHEYIERLPEGLATQIGERGVKLSGGQRQRIAIARAVLADPRILLLDEATSALDAESEALVQEALARLLKGRTAFVVAHRLATVRQADRVLVVEDGRIVEDGNHTTLMAAGGLYARLARLQFQMDDVMSHSDF
ncbi:ABC transporter transmembrane domain-containing protein [soil metagenome]